MELKENERIDDLEINGLKIIQNKTGFCFGIDAVLLSDFAKNLKRNAEVIDLGTGTGIIPLLLSAKSLAKHILGIEIQTKVSEMAQRSIKMNNLEKKIEIINADIRKLKNTLECNKYDVIVTNPPYMKDNTGLQNENKEKLISRHEIECTIKDIAEISSMLLKDKGEIYMIHRPDRLVDIVTVFRNHNLEIKNIRLVFPKKKRLANLVLIKAVKNGKPFLKIEEPLYVYEENGEYTNEIKQIYSKK